MSEIFLNVRPCSWHRHKTSDLSICQSLEKNSCFARITVKEIKNWKSNRWLFDLVWPRPISPRRLKKLNLLEILLSLLSRNNSFFSSGWWGFRINVLSSQKLKNLWMSLLRWMLALLFALLQACLIYTNISVSNLLTRCKAQCSFLKISSLVAKFLSIISHCLESNIVKQYIYEDITNIFYSIKFILINSKYILTCPNILQSDLKWSDIPLHV